MTLFLFQPDARVLDRLPFHFLYQVWPLVETDTSIRGHCQ